MATADKDKKAGMGGEIAGAVMAVLIGMILAGVYLVPRSPSVVREAPDADRVEPRTVYIIEGDRGGVADGVWRLKLQALITGDQSGVISFSEQELNEWGSRLRPVSDDDREGGVIPLTVTPGTPNFRVEGEQFQMTTEVEFDLMGNTRRFRAFTTGDFRRVDGGFRFRPEAAYLGMFRVPPLLRGWLISRVVDAYDSDEELKEGWARVAGVSVEESHLRVLIP